LDESLFCDLSVVDEAPSAAATSAGNGQTAEVQVEAGAGTEGGGSVSQQAIARDAAVEALETLLSAAGLMQLPAVTPQQQQQQQQQQQHQSAVLGLHLSALDVHPNSRVSEGSTASNMHEYIQQQQQQPPLDGMLHQGGPSPLSSLQEEGGGLKVQQQQQQQQHHSGGGGAGPLSSRSISPAASSSSSTLEASILSAQSASSTHQHSLGATAGLVWGAAGPGSAAAAAAAAAAASKAKKKTSKV
jgi:hypothetical protein